MSLARGRFAPPSGDPPARVAPERRGRTIRRVVGFFRPYRLSVTIVVVTIVATSLLGLINPILLKLLIDVAIPEEDFGLLTFYVVLMIVVPIVSVLIGVYQSYVNNVIGQSVMQDLRNALYAHLQRMPLRFFTETRTGEIQSRLANDVGGVQAVVTDTASSITSNVAVVASTIVAPDMHQGYGFPIGGGAATRYPEGVIAPGSIGYDINCGVRLLASNVGYELVKDQMDSLASSLNEHCPSGVGVKGAVGVTDAELERICIEGARWAVKHGFGDQDDLRRTEENGELEGADPAKVSKRAKERGRPQLGTLGAGNHFIEVDVVDQVFDPEAARSMGLVEGNLVIQIHCGSRGFGHQICSDYVEEFQGAVKRYGIHLPDRELVCAPLHSPEGQAYLGAMLSAANYAFANRQVLAHHARKAFEEIFSGKVPDWSLHQVYDIAHNMGKIETHLDS